MKNYVIYLVLLIAMGCKSLDNSGSNLDAINVIENDRYELKYPKSWYKSNVRGFNEINSLAIFKYKNIPKRNVWFSLVLDIYKVSNNFKLNIDDLISKDDILKKSKIIEVKTISKEQEFIEIIHLYSNINKVQFKYVTRFYKRNNKISKIVFASNEKTFKDEFKYQKLFFDTFKLK